MTIRQWFNPQIPFANTQGLRDMVVVAPQAVATSLDLRTVFGNMEGGAWKLFMRTDNLMPSGVPFKAYVNFSTNPGTVSSTAVGTSSGVGWPIAQDETFVARIFGGQKDVATGYATGLSPYVLNYAGQSVGSGLLHILRALDDVETPRAFHFPMPSGLVGAPTFTPSGFGGTWFP